MPRGAHTSKLPARPQGATPGTRGPGEPRLLFLGQECGWPAWLSSLSPSMSRILSILMHVGAEGCELPSPPVTSNQAHSLPALPGAPLLSSSACVCLFKTSSRPSGAGCVGGGGKPENQNEPGSLHLSHTGSQTRTPGCIHHCHTGLQISAPWVRPCERTLTPIPHARRREAWASAPRSPLSPNPATSPPRETMSSAGSGLRGRSCGWRESTPWEGESRGTEVFSPTGQPARTPTSSLEMSRAPWAGSWQTQVQSQGALFFTLTVPLLSHPSKKSLRLECLFQTPGGCWLQPELYSLTLEGPT